MVIRDEDEAEILRLHHAEKWPPTTIAEHLRVHHSVVTRVITADGAPPVRPQRPARIDAFVPFILDSLRRYPGLLSSRLYQMCRERGYRGSPDHFRHMVARHRPPRTVEAFLRTTALPGEHGQVDWAHFGKLRIGRAEHPLLAFVCVLSYSRRIFLRFYLDQRIENFLRGHVAAFAAWNGLPRVLLYDNLKSAVLDRRGDAILFNPRLVDFSKHYRFEIRPAAVARGNEARDRRRLAAPARLRSGRSSAVAGRSDRRCLAAAAAAGTTAARSSPADAVGGRSASHSRLRTSLIAASQPAVYLARRIAGARVTAGFTRIVAAADKFETDRRRSGISRCRYASASAAARPAIESIPQTRTNMSTEPFPCALASALLAGLLCGSALHAQNVASRDSAVTKPTLHVLEQAGGKCEYQLVAGPQHAGEPVCMLLSTSKDPAVALVESPLLEARTLDAKGNLQGVLAMGASGQALANNLMAVIIGQTGSPTGVSALAPGSTPQTIQGQPGGPPVCLVPSPPPCTGGQLPDLIITNIAFSVTQTSTACTGTALPQLMCGANGFDVTVTVQNVGTCAVPCRTNLTVLFGRGPSAGNLTFDPQPATVQTNDILPGATFHVKRHYYLGPCTGTLTQLQFYGAIVDSAGTIAELNEGNNAGTPVAGCEIL